ncbi:hypothetical protein Uis1B_0739 [Bifidobacterium margollesii]|uniref:Uncharacterized protein n=1 Tax=Bifidobacterium margollesii TaxID=2020964 RepID=A0A2N5JB12_9BIFI|nr:hypothetical protein [Bifidobacterium margollesii]PLS31398.1 hypothetical protein Uis1B_0739 [Bifidobacterium margollesii]
MQQEYIRPIMQVIELDGADIVRTSAGDTDVPFPGSVSNAR